LLRSFAVYLELEPVANEVRLREYAGAVRGMAEADATEVNIAGYLRSLEASHLAEEHHGPPARITVARGSNGGNGAVRPGKQRPSPGCRPAAKLNRAGEVPCDECLHWRSLRSW
jgi:hypothetical protein